MEYFINRINFEFKTVDYSPHMTVNMKVSLVKNQAVVIFNRQMYKKMLKIDKNMYCEIKILVTFYTFIIDIKQDILNIICFCIIAY